MSTRVVRTYAVVLAAAVVASFFIDSDGYLSTGWQIGVGYVAAGAIVVGARQNARGHRAVWWLFAVGIGGNATGILVEALLTHLYGWSAPSLADAFYLSLYPALAIGLALLIHRRTSRTDWGTLVDATTVTTGLGLLAWIFMIRPAATDPTLSMVGHLVSVLYPVGDVVLLAMVVRLQLNAGTRTTAFWLMSGSLLTFLANDTAWAVVNRLVAETGYLLQHTLAAAALIAYGLFGAAALHPSARELTVPEEGPPPRLSTGLLSLLTAAALIAPLLLMIQTVTHQFHDELAISIGSIGLMLLVVTRMAQILRQLEKQSAWVRQLSQTDDLTGLPNRRSWTAELPSAIEHARQAGLPLSVAMLDLDHFKQFNDSYGHPAGDRLLKAAAAAWLAQLRTTDKLARYGGEEFIVLLPAAPGSAAQEVVERLRAATPLGQTLSAGLATWDGRETSEELVARADRALYGAKQAGRNRVLLATPET